MMLSSRQRLQALMNKNKSIINSIRSIQSASDAASDVSYTRGLFLGVNNVSRAFPYPSISSDDQETLTALAEPVSKYFASNVDSKKIDETKEIPPSVLNDLKEMGLFGLQIPENLDGLGLSNTGYARVCEEVAVDASIGVTVMAHQSIGLKGILLHGNEAQKAKYLPPLATGEHIAAFALTEPSSGSDAASIKTKAVLSDDKSHFILNGGKIWISNGGWANVMTVFAQTPMENGKEKVTAFIVESSYDGVSTGPPEDKLGIRGSNTCQVFFDNVKVPVENVLGGGEDGKTGGIAGVGQGFKVAMNILNNGRFGLGACAGSQLKKIIGMAAEHATSRKQFSRPLSSFGLIQEKFAKMALNAYAIESMAYMTTGMIDEGDGSVSCEIEAAMCKVFGSEVAFDGINEAIQIMGGTGFMRDYPFERIMRDSRILSIFEGTNEILRMLIALSGVKVAGDRAKELLKALKNPLTDPKGVWTEVSSRAMRKVLPVSSSSSLDGVVHSSLEQEGKNLGNLTALFGDAVEGLLRVHGKDVIEQQVALKRVADIAIDLFAITASLSRASRSLSNNTEGAEHEKKLASAFSKMASDRITQNLKDLSSSSRTAMDGELSDIASDIFKELKYIPSHPTGVNT